MTACRKLATCGLHPIHLSLIINIGMLVSTLMLCIATLPQGIVFLSTNLSSGLFGFLNPEANPAALLHSIFPDLGGNFGIMLALHYFDPLIVSSKLSSCLRIAFCHDSIFTNTFSMNKHVVVMLTEPLNASVIAMYAVNEAPPSRRTILGVSVVLVGCAIVLLESSKDSKNGKETRKRSDSNDTLETASITDSEEGYVSTQGSAPEQVHREEDVSGERQRRSSAVLYSQLGKISPNMAAEVCLEINKEKKHRRRRSLPDEILCNYEEIQILASVKTLKKKYNTFNTLEREEVRDSKISIQTV